MKANKDWANQALKKNKRAPRDPSIILQVS